jgi:hypothetical protein
LGVNNDGVLGCVVWPVEKTGYFLVMKRPMAIAGLLAVSLLSACGGTSKYVVGHLCVDDPFRFIKSPGYGLDFYRPRIGFEDPYVALIWSDGTFSVANSPNLKWEESDSGNVYYTSEYEHFNC